MKLVGKDLDSFSQQVAWNLSFVLEQTRGPGERNRVRSEERVGHGIEDLGNAGVCGLEILTPDKR